MGLFVGSNAQPWGRVFWVMLVPVGLVLGVMLRPTLGPHNPQEKRLCFLHPKDFPSKQTQASERISLSHASPLGSSWRSRAPWFPSQLPPPGFAAALAGVRGGEGGRRRPLPQPAEARPLPAGLSGSRSPGGATQLGWAGPGCSEPSTSRAERGSTATLQLDTGHGPTGDSWPQPSGLRCLPGAHAPGVEVSSSVLARQRVLLV
ncbi:LOW QUALITY PROTEIN: uncharacterized protein [Chamaea fasciata]|uniref:LOW QUALITY PROTEIN: uncharacterized protein n=1 Tax=Chamaea fasciata TaxID=190680 RepID=UPI00336ACE25